MEEYPYTFKKEYHGTGGPVQVTIPRTSFRSDKIFLDALVNLGVPFIDDAYAGNVYPFLNSML